MEVDTLSKISNVEPALLESILLSLDVKDILQFCGSDKNRYNICTDEFWLKKVYHDYTQEDINLLFVDLSSIPDNLSLYLYLQDTKIYKITIMDDRIDPTEPIIGTFIFRLTDEQIAGVTIALFIVAYNLDIAYTISDEQTTYDHEFLSDYSTSYIDPYILIQNDYTLEQYDDYLLEQTRLDRTKSINLLTYIKIYDPKTYKRIIRRNGRYLLFVSANTDYNPILQFNTLDYMYGIKWVCDILNVDINKYFKYLIDNNKEISIDKVFKSLEQF